MERFIYFETLDGCTVMEKTNRTAPLPHMYRPLTERLRVQDLLKVRRMDDVGFKCRTYELVSVVNDDMGIIYTYFEVPEGEVITSRPRKRVENSNSGEDNNVKGEGLGKMQTITARELKARIEKHYLWLHEKEHGERLILAGFDLSSANLRSANLSYADLSSADLRYADLRYADLRYANLSSANLRYADLRYADLSSANLRYVKKDIHKVLDIAKFEVPGLYDSLQKGLIDGSCYEGQCCCLVGTIANIRHEKFDELGIDLKPDSNRPAEMWFMGIHKGDIPASNQVSKITAEWIEEWARNNDVELPTYKIVSSHEAPELFTPTEEVAE